ncbi:type IV secretory system conjugative DNA transfer family protein [Chryseobacterium sp. HMWF001]|nr:type IV secretory system conjugative DNA transfer family protein [Chryseobacterium sp. HMWF001]PTT73413.1 conjugal transfer protein TraG [Chryseobacterium sp. HMWF001]
MKQLDVNHHTQESGCLKYIFPAIVVLIIMYLLKIPLFSITSIIPAGIIYFAVFKGLPIVWRMILKSDLKKYVPEKLQNILPEKKANAEVFSINGETEILNPYSGIFISGGAGSGKSKSLIEPLIKEAGAKGYTGVIYDFKFPELAQYTETAYMGSDIARYYFNFEDLTRSHRINPISPELMTKEAFAREFAYTILVNLNPQMISKPDFWSDNATSLLASTFWYLREKHPSFCTLPHAISMILQPNFEALLRELCSVPKCGDMIAPIMTAYEQGADNQLAGVLSSLQVSLSKINSDEIYYLMSESDFSLELNNPDKKGILTIGNNPQLSSTYAPLIGLILTSISKQLNRQGKEKSIFMVDEFPTVYIPNVEQLPATARSNKVATILACQDIAQLSDKYGREKTETILSNLGNQFYGRTPNPQTAKRVSEIFGKAEQVVVSESKRTFDLSDKNVTTSTRETDIVKSQDVANLDTGSFFTVLSEGLQRQGISHIPMDRKFVKTEIEPFSSADENEVKKAYKRISFDVSEVILRESILATQKK